MTRRYLTTLFILPTLILILDLGLVHSREILFSKAMSGGLEQIAVKIADPDTPKIPYENLKRTNRYFARIAPREYILTEDNRLQDSAIIGTKPFIFITTPESVYGKTLLEIYLDIGYEAEDIIRQQRDKDMVAILFRYGDEITFSAVKDGRIPNDWQDHVYIPTWDNLFTLFGNLANDASIEPNKRGEFAPEKSFFRSETEKQFVLSFPEAGKSRIKAANYSQLRSVNGGDWVYRSLLESKLSVFEHFRGDGRTHNEVIFPGGFVVEAGLLEFVGPNKRLKGLPELAIIDLGRLTMEDTHSGTAAAELMKWVPANGGQVPKGAVQGGQEAPPRREALYVCRARYQGGVHPGKLRKAFGGCNIGWGGRERMVRSYEVLVQ